MHGLQGWGPLECVRVNPCLEGYLCFSGLAGYDEHGVQGAIAGNFQKIHKTGTLISANQRSFSKICETADRVLFASVQSNPWHSLASPVTTKSTNEIWHEEACPRQRDPGHWKLRYEENVYHKNTLIIYTSENKKYVKNMYISFEKSIECRNNNDETSTDNIHHDGRRTFDKRGRTYRNEFWIELIFYSPQNEFHRKGTTSHILWYSDWLHNTNYTGSSIFVANHNTTSAGSSIIQPIKLPYSGILMSYMILLPPDVVFLVNQNITSTGSSIM